VAPNVVPAAEADASVGVGKDAAVSVVSVGEVIGASNPELDMGAEGARTPLTPACSVTTVALVSVPKPP
jgi:hypothetical protein